MKKKPKLFVILTFIITIVSGSCGSNPTSSSTASIPDELDLAIRDASDYLNGNIPNGSMIVILNIQSDSAALSDYIIDELIANAVNDKIFKVVDRQQLDLIRTEQNFQLSGEVDDNLALSIGKFFGAQTIVSGRVSQVADRYRMTIRALEVQTAQVQGQYNRNITAGKTITALMKNSGGTQSTISRTSGSSNNGTGSGTSQPSVSSPSNQAPSQPPNEVSTPLTIGTMVPGNSLSEKLAWLQRSADSHNTYILEVNTNENIAPQTFEFRGAINITVVLRGDNENRTIRLISNGTMFTVRSNVTFVLENNITLQGHNGNNGNIVNVEGGMLRMNAGATITGNNGIGAYVNSGTFEMSGGTISNNISYDGGGVYLNSGTFNMSGGIISGNASTGNASFNGGGGVYVGRIGSVFTMSGGTISGNTASNGGGVYVGWATFNMRGGTIRNNTAHEYGGGVFIESSFAASGEFTKTGGTITGYSNDPNNGNVVKDQSGNILARRGHTVSVGGESRKRDTTAGQGVNMSYKWPGDGVGWDR